jgi:hypothetical protein
MTHRETAALDKLRDELHAYHVDVQRLVERCESCRQEVVQLTTDIYGLPGNKDASPGLIGDVADLRRSRTLTIAALRGAWIVLTILLGAASSAFFHAP